MLKIRKGDTVAVMKGKDKGKKGKVMKIFLANRKAVVEGINYVKKAQRRTRQDQQQSGIIQVERPLALANLRVICKNCQAPAKVGFTVLKDKTKSRVCKKCNEVF